MIVFVILQCTEHGLYLSLMFWDSVVVCMVDFYIRIFSFLLHSETFLLKGKQMHAFGYSFWTTVVTVTPAEVHTRSFPGIVRYIKCRLSLQM